MSLMEETGPALTNENIRIITESQRCEEMALVAYDNSDSSDDEENIQGPAVVVSKGATTTARQSVKIGLPSFQNAVPADSDDSDDEKAPVVRKPRPPGAKSGLASFLPQPKASKGKSISLVPPNVQSRIQAARNATKHKKSNLTGTAQPTPSEKEDQDDAIGTSFFSHLESKSVEVPSSVKVGPRMPQKPQVDPFSLYDYEGDGMACMDGQDTQSVQQQQQIHSPAGVQGSRPDGNDSLNLDPEALRKLAGKKRRREDINIVDINEGDVQQKDQEKLKKFSEGSAYQGSGRGRGRGVTALHKKKHQLTYLIHEAKEKEIQLKQEWAANKSSRRESRMKYGF